MILAHTAPSTKRFPNIYWSLDVAHNPVSEPAQNASSTKTVNLLAVSDCPITLQKIGQIGEKRGWHVLEAASLRQAWAALLRDQVNVVITDEELPGGTWRDVLSETTSHPAEPAVLVLARSLRDPLWEEVLRHGGIDVLACPLDEHDLEQAVLSAAKEARHPECSGLAALRTAVAANR